MATARSFISLEKVRIRFDDNDILEHMNAKQARAASRVGGTIRLIARRSIRKAKKRKAGEKGYSIRSKKTGRKLYGAAAKSALRTGSAEKVKEPRQGSGSKPGGPPRYRERGPGSLKDGIFYGYSPRTKTLSVGPILTTSKRQGGKTVPEALEFGSTVNRQFPFMAPALEQATKRGEILKAMEAF